MKAISNNIGGAVMNYIGKWLFHSIGVINESGNLTYMSAEE